MRERAVEVQAVARIYRVGDPRTYRVALACGHKRTMTNEEVRHQQIFIGKRMVCRECGAKEKGGFCRAAPQRQSN